MHYFYRRDKAYLLPLYGHISNSFDQNWHCVKCLTKVQVGVESQSAVLYVEGEGVDIEVTGADNFDWKSIVYHTIAIHVQIRDKGSGVFIHTARQEPAEELWVKSLQYESMVLFLNYSIKQRKQEVLTSHFWPLPRLGICSSHQSQSFQIISRYTAALTSHVRFSCYVILYIEFITETIESKDLAVESPAFCGALERRSLHFRI